MRNTQELMDANSTVNSQSIQQKIMLLRSRYKSTKDLHIYMTDHRKFQLPHSITFLQWVTWCHPWSRPVWLTYRPYWAVRRRLFSRQMLLLGQFLTGHSWRWSDIIKRHWHCLRWRTTFQNHLAGKSNVCPSETFSLRCSILCTLNTLRPLSSWPPMSGKPREVMVPRRQQKVDRSAPPPRLPVQ